MDLFTYTVFSVVYIMLYYLALDWRGENSGFVNWDTWDWFYHMIAGIFLFGAALGYLTNSYSFGFVVAMVLSMIFTDN